MSKELTVALIFTPMTDSVVIVTSIKMIQTQYEIAGIAEFKKIPATKTFNIGKNK